MMINTKTEDRAGGADEIKPAKSSIDTRLVYGFLGAGKTVYIQENIMSDVFWKYGSTLVLCFEQGEEAYDTAALKEKRAAVVCYDGGEIGSFCTECIRQYSPDRIYIEMNAMMGDLKAALPACLRKTFAITLIEWKTMPLYYRNFAQMIRLMTADSAQVIFRGCPSADLLAPYAQGFRLMNPRASYLRQDPMGYHEKAFGMFLPYSLPGDPIVIREESFLPLWLDALDHPEHYDGKQLVFSDPVELKRTGSGCRWSCGRTVLTCCMQDLQFMSFEVETGAERESDGHEGWITGRALAFAAAGEYGQRKLRLRFTAKQTAAPPEVLILDGRYRQE